MHVVLIAYHYPPSREVGAIRAQKVSNALIRAGHQVTVIRASATDENTRDEDPMPGLRVRTVRPIPGPRQLYARLKQSRVRHLDAAGKANAAGQPWTPRDDVPLLKRVAFSLMKLPDDRQGFIPVAVRAAVAAGRDHRGPSILYTSGPPHSTHVAGLITAYWSGLPWAIEFRDPWIDNPGKPSDARTAITDRIDRSLEKACLRQAELVVSVSDGIDEVLRSHFPGRPNRFIVVRNGIDNLRPAIPTGHQTSRPFRIVYTGSLYLGRDPTPFLTSLARVAAKHKLDASRLAVDFIGECSSYNGTLMTKLLDELGLSEIVRVHPWLERAEAKKRVDEADLLLLLARGQPSQVPNKLYEYLGSGRPMLVFADADGETARMVRSVGGHYVVESDEQSIAVIEQAVVGEGTTVRPVNRTILNEWRTERQMERLVAAIEEVGQRVFGARIRANTQGAP